MKKKVKHLNNFFLSSFFLQFGSIDIAKKWVAVNINARWDLGYMRLGPDPGFVLKGRTRTGPGPDPDRTRTGSGFSGFSILNIVA